MGEKTELKWFLFVLAIAAALRLTGINYGLPAVFNADEPHIVNVAVSFGAGTLNPHLFRYPTLWMYTLFACYGVFFLIWSGFGLLHSVQQFGALFVWHPTPFYLIARVMAAVFSLLGIERVYACAKLIGRRRAGLWAAAMLAVPFPIVTSAHAAKPESLMFFVAAWAWWFALRYCNEGGGRDLIVSGFLVGLCGAAQYTAAPFGILVPAAWLLKRRGNLMLALIAVPAGFLAGCPFALLDYPAFTQMVHDLRAMGHLGGVPPMNWWLVLRNVPTFAGTWLPGGLVFILGAIELFRSDRPRAILFSIPIAAFWITMSLAFDGSIPRYLFAVFPAIALIAGIGTEAVVDWLSAAPCPFQLGKVREPLLILAALAVLMIPGGLPSAAYDREILLPDTRTISAEWVEKNIPAGSKMLLDQEHASPRLIPSLPLVEKMIEQTKAAGHPRLRYYELMRQSHPGGGYETYQILRDATDLWAMPGHVAFSAQGRPVLDVRPGLDVARKAGIQYIVLTSHGAEAYRSPEVAQFLRQTEEQGKLLADFDPPPGKETGPHIRVYKIQ